MLPYVVFDQVLTEDACVALIEYACGQAMQDYAIVDDLTGVPVARPRERRVKTAHLTPHDETQGAFGAIIRCAERVSDLLCLHRNFVRVEATILRYDAGDHIAGWHKDTIPRRDFDRSGVRRTISVSVELSRPQDYVGAELEFRDPSRCRVANRARGTGIVFPSNSYHRVTKVKEGQRWALVGFASAATTGNV